MYATRGLCGVLAAAALGAACASTSPLRRQECYNADTQLVALLGPFEALQAQDCTIPGRNDSECSRLRHEIERLTLVCPGHAPTLMANAVIAYDNGQTARAQQFLDSIFARPGRHPEAAVLRARIALDEGNASFARRLIEQQIHLAPDLAPLHETLAAALYLTGDLSNARHEIAVAVKLGAPGWRAAYHLGLIEEAAGRLDEAERQYAEAAAGNPDWEPARAHLNGLRARLAGSAPQ